MEPVLPDTLIVRRLPEALTERDLNELFRFFGAQTVKKEKPKGKQRNSIALVKFQSHEDASYALTRLHQLLVLGKRIVVEYADFSILPDVPHAGVPSNSKDEQNWKYPAANENIVKNIAETLLTNPDFYHKVLQLMRNMNLTPPFCPTPKLVVVQQTEIEEVEMEELYKEDTEESELETDFTAVVAGEKDLLIPQVPVRRKKLKHLKRPNQLKMVLNPTAVGKAKLSSGQTTAVSEVFEKEPTSITKKLEFKISSTEILHNNTDPSLEETEKNPEGFGTFAPTLTIEENEEKSLLVNQENEEENQEFISKRKLQMNKLMEEEMKLLSVFKNYNAGVPSARLYVKNLAKTVKESDLKHIYGRYVLWTLDEERNMFDIRLMTEGRMKGQAFITLPNLSRAQEALGDTNGVMLQGKPLVVQFARSANTVSTNA